MRDMIYRLRDMIYCLRNIFFTNLLTSVLILKAL